MYQNVPSVGMFDKDNKNIVKQVSGGSVGYRRWSRGVYSFVLPSPPHRDADEPLCIEMLHLDSTLETKDAAGRRIYRNNEFKESGFHADGDAVKTKGGSALIVSEVRDISTQENIALSKDGFAELIAKKKAPFDKVDMSGFKAIFEKLAEIRQQWLLND